MLAPIVRTVTLAAVLSAVLLGGAVLTQTMGGDLADLYQVADYQCLINNGWSFVIVRGYHNYGAVDVNAPQNIANAQQAGLSSIDVYLFPCVSQDPTQQVQATIQNAGTFGNLWLDIETNPDSNCAWTDANDNCNFIATMIQAAQGASQSVGVYASNYMWSSITGGCTAGADAGAALWYAHYDGNANFGDFSPFGGWTTPFMKQYWDSIGFCNVNADADVQ